MTRKFRLYQVTQWLTPPRRPKQEPEPDPHFRLVQLNDGYRYIVEVQHRRKRGARAEREGKNGNVT